MYNHNFHDLVLKVYSSKLDLLEKNEFNKIISKLHFEVYCLSRIVYEMVEYMSEEHRKKMIEFIMDIKENNVTRFMKDVL